MNRAALKSRSESNDTRSALRSPELNQMIRALSSEVPNWTKWFALCALKSRTEPNESRSEVPNWIKLIALCPDFKIFNKKTQIQYLLGEKQDCILLAARYIDACHKKREESTNQWCAHKHTQTPNLILICSGNPKMLVCIFFLHFLFFI